MTETKTRLRVDTEQRKAVVRHEQKRRQHAREMLEHRNLYATTIARKSVANAKAYEAQRRQEETHESPLPRRNQDESPPRATALPHATTTFTS
jgi:hypothetical protein